VAGGALEDGVEVGTADAAVVGDGFDGEVGLLWASAFLLASR
jgi:hypothetical protein